MTHFILIFALLHWSGVKDSTCNVEEMQETQARFWVSQIPWRRAWQSSPVYLPGEHHGPETTGQQSMGSHRVRTRLKRMSTGLEPNLQTVSNFGGVFLKSVKNSKAFVSEVCLYKMKGYCLQKLKNCPLICLPTQLKK